MPGHGRYAERMKFKIELEQEQGGRWIAEISDLPGALAYGSTRDQAISGVEALALRVIADRLEHAEIVTLPTEISFQSA